MLGQSTGRLVSTLVLLAVLTSVYSITRTGVPAAQAAAPTTLNFQARLTASNGALVPDGYYNVEFKLYNVNSGGTALWTETHYDSNGVTAGNDNRIQVKNGYLSAYLGDVTALPSNIWNQQLWLTMNIGGSTQTASPTWDGEMTPRIRLTSVPYAYRATIAESAETLSKNTGSFTGTVDFMNLTADRRYLFPDTSLATTASPGTICVYNGLASNCPAASGSAYYIQNDTIVQTQSNFNIQARDSTTNGTVAGVFRGAAAGQTVDLVQFQATNGTVLGAVTASGSLQVASSLDVRTVGTLNIGTSTANAISIGGTGVTTTNNGALTVTQAFTANGGAAVTGVTTINTSGSATTTIGNASAGIILNGAVTANQTSTFNAAVTIAAQQTIRFVGGTTAQRPASPTEGMLYFDTDTKSLLIYSNGKWQADGKDALIVAASDSSQKDKDAADYVANGNTATANDGDQVEINQALTAGAGKKVILLAGTYVADATILVPNNTTLSGVGNGSVIELADLDATDNLIENSDTASGTGLVIENLKLDGRSDVNTAGTQYGVYLNGMGDFGTARNGGKIHDVQITRFRSTGLYMNASSNNVITNNTLKSNGNGIVIAASSQANTLSNNLAVTNTNEGYVISGSTYNVLTGNIATDNGTIGFALTLSSSNNTLTGNTAVNHVTAGIQINTSTRNTITGNSVRGGGSALYSLQLTSGANNNTVSGNNLYHTGGAAANNAIYIDASDYNYITGNVIGDISCTTTCYAINIPTSTSDGNYLANNSLDDIGTINNLGTGTIFAGQTNSGTAGNYLIQPTGTIELLKTTNITGNLGVSGTLTTTGAASLNGGATVRGNLTVNTATATDDQLIVSVATGGAARFNGTLTSADLTAARTWTLPDVSGSICLDSSVNNCNYLTTTAAATGYIQNQNAGPQASSNFYISGSGRTSGSFTADTSVLTPTIDTASAIALNIGTTNATGINLNKSVTIAAQQTIRFVGGTTAQRPASPTEGMLYFDTDTKSLLIYSNGKWQADGKDALIVAASDSSQKDKDAADYVANGNTATANDGDQVEINQALTAGAGKKVILLAGTYTVDASISIPNNTTLTGVGASTVITIPNGVNANFSAIVNSDQTTGTRITVQDLLLEGNKNNQSGTNIGMVGIDFVNLGYGTGASSMQGARITNVHSNNWYSNGTTTNCQTGAGICLRNSYYGVIANSAALGSNSGIRLSTSGGIAITSNNLQGNVNGIRVVNTSINNTITGNLLTANTNAITTDAGSNNTFIGNQIFSSTTYGISLGNNSNNNTITGNVFQNNGGNTTNNAVYIDNSDNNTITGNSISDSSATTNNFAINIINNTSDASYLADNMINGATVNNVGTGTIFAGQVNGTTFAIQPSSAFAITGTAASTISTSAGNLTLQAGSGTVTLGSSTALTASAALTITSGGNNALTLDAGGAAALNVGTASANAVSIGRTGITATINGALAVTQASTFTGLATFNGGLTVETGDTFTFNGDAFTDLTGAGLTIVSGALTVDTTSATGFFQNGGNSFGAAATIGTNDNFGLTLETNNTAAVVLDNSQNATFNGNVTVATQKTITLVGGTTAQRPASPTEGMVYFDTTTKQLLIYSNGKWQADGKDALIVAASNSSQKDKDAADYVANGNTATANDGDQVEINQALTAGAGKKVILLAGTYIIDASISVPNNTTLTGLGEASYIELADIDVADVMIENTDQSTGNGVTVQNLQLNGRDDLNAGTQEAVMIRFAGSIGSGRLGATVSGLKITNVDRGINVSDSENVTVSGNTIDATDLGILLQSVYGTMTTNNRVSRSLNNGLEFYGGSENVFTNNIFHDNGGASIYMNGGVSNTIANNTFDFANGMGVSLAGSNRTIIANNNFREPGGSGNNNAIYLDNSDNSSITGNVVFDSSGTTTNFGINITNSTSDNTYLANNTLNGSSINNVGTGTVYGGQTNAAGNYLVQSAGTIELMKNTNVTGDLTTTGRAFINYGADISLNVADSTPALTVNQQNAGSTGDILRLRNNTGTVLTVVQDGSLFSSAQAVFRNVTTNTASITDDQLVFAVTAGGAARFNGTLTSADLTANRTWTLPNESGTICTTASAGACSGLYIQNQNAAQQTANYWISGTARADTSVLTPLVGRATAGTLSVGTDTNSTALTISRTGVLTTIAGSLTVSEAGQFNGGLTSNSNFAVTNAGNVAFQNGATADITTLTLTDFAIGSGALFRLNGVSAQTISSIAGGADGRLITLINASAFTTTIQNDTGGTAANRILTGTGSNVSLFAGGSIQLAYDSDSLRWRIIGTTSQTGGYANTSLSNLGTTSINASLLAGTANTIDLGSTTNGWRTLYADTSVLTPLVGRATAGTLSIGTDTNSTALTISRTGVTTTVAGALTVTQAGQFNGGLTVASNFTVTSAGNVAFQRNTSDITTTGTLTDVNIGTGVLFRFSGASAQTISSIANPADGRIVTLINAAATALVIQNDTGGTAANRIITGTGGDISVPSGATITLAYDSSSSRWRVIGSTAATGGYVQLQGTTPGTAQTGNINVNGTIIAGTAIQTGLIDTPTGTTTLNIGTTNATAGINLNQSTNILGNLTFSQGSNRSVSVATRTTNAAGNNLTISAGAAGAGASAFSGGTLNLQGGAAGGTGNANGGAVTISGGAGVGTGTQGLVNLATTAFTSATVQTYGAGITTITQSLVDNFSTIPVTATATTAIASVPNPSQNDIGRVLYIAARDGSTDFTLRLNAASTPIDIAMKQNSTATLIWNGARWTAAGASSSTDLQSAYNNTLTSAGGAEILLNPVGGNADGFTIRNNGTTPIVGGLLEVQSSIGSNLLSVNNNSTEFAVNGGAESSVNFSTNWTTTTGGTVDRWTTPGDFVATGVASTRVQTTTTNHGAKNVLSSTLTAGMTYSVSFAVRGTANFTTLQVLYSPDGTTTGTTTCATGRTVTQGAWTRVLCTFVAAGTINSANAILIRQTDAATRTFYIDNLSVTVNANMTFAADGSVDSALGTNWTAFNSGTPTRTTTEIYDTTGAVAVATTAANQGVRNNMAVTPAINTQYLVTFYAKATVAMSGSLKVGFLPAGGNTVPVTAQECVDYSTQSVTTTSWTRITCLISTPAAGISDPDLVIYQTDATARTFYVDALTINLNTNNSNNVQIGGANKGGPTTLLTLDRASTAPIAANNDAYLGSMYYDTTTGRIQCYEADGWGACGSSPDNIISLTPEYTGAVLGTPGNALGAGNVSAGVGVLTADFCSNQTGVLVTPATGNICASGEARNFYRWTSPQTSQQVYSIFVNYKLPTTFKAFNDSNTISLTALTDNLTNGVATLQVFRKSPTAVSSCGAATTINTSINTWQTTPFAGDETTCQFAGGDNIIFKIDVKSQSNGNIYIENLNFVFTNN